MPSKERLETWSKIAPHTTPIFQTSVYDYPDLETFDDFYNGLIPGGYLYSRNGLPNSTELARLVSEYEKTESGVVCSSGMGALTVAFLSQSKKGDHVVASDKLYGGTTTFIEQELSRFGIDASFVDTTSHENISRALRKNTKIVIVETISNPTMEICDLEKLAKMAHEVNSIFLVDNTFATPFVTRPSEFGADIVMHSGTKFLGGHADLTLGVLCGKRKVMERASQFCTRAGVIAGPFDCWLATRSLSTWKVRVKQSCQNALKLAGYLESRNDVISKVYYPGLKSHLQHKLAPKIFDHEMFGGMLSFDLKGGLSDASKFVKQLSKVTLTPSLGGVRTTISHPGKTSHRNLAEKQKKKSGITNAMIRVSVGIEDYSLIEKEFGKALNSLR